MIVFSYFLVFLDYNFPSSSCTATTALPPSLPTTSALPCCFSAMSPPKPASTGDTPAEGRSPKVKGRLGIRRSRGKARRASLTSLLYAFIILGPAVTGRPPSTVIVEKDEANLTVTVFEEDRPPGPRCMMWRGEVSNKAD